MERYWGGGGEGYCPAPTPIGVCVCVCLSAPPPTPAGRTPKTPKQRRPPVTRGLFGRAFSLEP